MQQRNNCSTASLFSFTLSSCFSCLHTFALDMTALVTNNYQRHFCLAARKWRSPWLQLMKRGSHSDTTAAVTQSPPPHYNVMIVGGGVVGSTLALHLSTTVPSLKVALLHGPHNPPTRADLGSIPTNPRAYALSPTSLKLMGEPIVQQLQQMGRIAAYNKIQVWESDGPSVLTFTSKDIIDPIASPDELDETQILGNTLGAVVEDEVLVACLWDTLRLKNNVSLISPSNIVNIQSNHSYPPVSVSYQNILSRNHTQGHVQSVQSATTDLLIAADGANSFVRRHVGSFPIASLSYNRRAITCTVLLNQSLNRTAFQRFQPNGPIALLPILETPTDSCQYYANIVWSTTPEEARSLKSLTDSEFIHHLNQILQMGPTTAPPFLPTNTLFPNASLGVDRILQSVNAGLTMSGWTERPQSSFIVPPIIHQVIGPRLDFDLNLMQATKYVSGRIVLVGDAAHTVHPMAGLGLNLGLSDVKCLSRLLKEAVESGMWDGKKGTYHSMEPSLLEDYFLKRYESERQRQVSLIQGGIQFLHGAFNTTFAPAVHARSLGMNIVNLMGPMRRTCAKIAAGVVDL